jgi:hypothetical protein
MHKRLVLVLAALVAAIVPTASATADTAPAPPHGDHCVVHVTGQRASGELTVSSPRCYASHRSAMTAEGVGARRQGATFEIGYHCDGYHLVAPCTSVVGDSCTGGWLNTSAFWSNRISSTRNGCPTVRHHDRPNLAGSVKATVGTGPHNLTTFDNRTESLQYL